MSISFEYAFQRYARKKIETEDTRMRAIHSIRLNKNLLTIPPDPTDFEVRLVGLLELDAIPLLVVCDCFGINRIGV